MQNVTNLLLFRNCDWLIPNSIRHVYPENAKFDSNRQYRCIVSDIDLKEGMVSGYSRGNTVIRFLSRNVASLGETYFRADFCLRRSRSVSSTTLLLSRCKLNLRTNQLAWLFWAWPFVQYLYPDTREIHKREARRLRTEPEEYANTHRSRV